LDSGIAARLQTGYLLKKKSLSQLKFIRAWQDCS
jgi:hypothetical protein